MMKVNSFENSPNLLENLKQEWFKGRKKIMINFSELWSSSASNSIEIEQQNKSEDEQQINFIQKQSRQLIPIKNIKDLQTTELISASYGFKSLFDWKFLAMKSMISYVSDIQSLETEDLMARFRKLMRNLTKIDDSKNYGLNLREAEEIILKLETDLPSQDEIIRMREQFNHAFQNLPSGPGWLMQLDVDHFNRFAHVPLNVVCRNQQSKLYRQPSVSMEQLVNHFFILGYSKVQHARETNFEESPEICDIILIGIDTDFRINDITTIFLNFFGQGSTQSLTYDYSHEIEKLDEYFMLNKKAYELGYQKAEFKLIQNFKDQERATNFINQGLHICIIFTYPEVQSHL